MLILKLNTINARNFLVLKQNTISFILELGVKEDLISFIQVLNIEITCHINAMSTVAIQQ